MTLYVSATSPRLKTSLGALHPNIHHTEEKHRMDDAYYSLDQLLAENQKIPCIFNINVPGMGYLEGAHERDVSPMDHQHTKPTKLKTTFPWVKIQAYSTIEIPFWLASILSQQEEDENQNYLTIQIPAAFNLQIRNALAASTKNVNLKNLAAVSGGAWYESGMALLDMIDDLKLKVVLHKTFSDRLTDVMDLAARPPLRSGQDRSSTSANTTSGHHNNDELAMGLDSWERELLLAGQAVSKRLADWTQMRLIS
ncbi:hypothetical protein VP01_210g23 [Puccinia sorghi]|uniref:DNA replication complex GINS protein PSF3 n=1 Tax=Puccinia sorghi TaxID=27349 RepID=A0A0L6VAA2_9BASI|nr:hypothetical protein VP01_210g23 [Puccinia sorghi]